MDDSPKKRCTICGQWLPLSMFGKKSSTKDGLRNCCKPCHYATCKPDPVRRQRYLKEYRTKNKERRAAYNRQYRLDHHEQEQQRRLENREKKREYDRHYHQRHRERKVKMARSWYQKNKERKRQYDQHYSKKRTSIQRKVWWHRYITRKQGLLVQFTIHDWQRALSYFHGCCAVCGRPVGFWHTLAADHWIPLNSPRCPGTVPDNIVPLCQGIDGCNNSKGDTDAEQWLHEKFGPRRAGAILRRITAYFEWMKFQS